MRILVLYASKYGATKEIAERIARRLDATGLQTEVLGISDAGDPSGYDAFVIGSAVYIEHWLKEAAEYVQRNQALLTLRPVWLFASGPLGTEKVDSEGRDMREAAIPKEFAELDEAIRPRDMRVFFGVLAPGKLGFRDRLIRMLPAGRALLPEGDFRDWEDVEGWAEGIAEELKRLAASES